MKENNEFHILYTFNSVNVLESLNDKSNNIRTLSNIKKSLLEMFKENNNINIIDKVNKKIEKVIKEQLKKNINYLEIQEKYRQKKNKNIQIEMEERKKIQEEYILEIAEYIKQLIRFFKFSKEEIKYLIEKEDIKIEVMSNFEKINLDVLKNIVEDKKDKDLTELKILEQNTFDQILKYVFSPFQVLILFIYCFFNIYFNI